MYTILMSWYSLDPASDKETRESLNQEKERERERDRRPYSHVKKA